ncbi:MAG: hypothetical protein EU544_04005, partial [Promethearchaeota archaeon]
MKRKISKSSIISITLTLTLLTGLFFEQSIINYPQIPLLEEILEEETAPPPPKCAGYWDNFTFIHIDGNWSNWEGKPWLKGDGSWKDPFILENFTINATESPTHRGILI